MDAANSDESLVTLDDILTDAPAPEKTVTPEVQSEEVSQPRDEAGRFANKQAEAEQKPDDTAQDQTQQPEGEDAKGHVPQQALHAERQKRKTLEDDNADLRRQMQEMQRQLQALSAPKPEPKEQPKPKSLWEDPDGFVNERLSTVNQAVMQQHFITSRMLADDKYGAEVVEAADAALGELIQQNPQHPEVIAMQARIKTARHPYAELVQWHERRKAMADIGDDPAAYRAKLEAEIRAQLAAEAGGQPITQAPSSTKPLTQLPKSLSKLPGGGNAAAEADMSDAGIFAQAIGG